MAARGLGIDEGGATVKAVTVEKKGGVLAPVAAVAIPAGGEALDAAALKAALAAAGVKERSALVGLTGKDLVVKYQAVPPVADFQLRKIVEFELEEMKKQSGDTLAADFNVMPSRADLTNDDIVMLALSREQRIDERSAALQAAGIAARHFTPNAVALFHAFRVFGPATSGDVLVASIGKGSSDFAVIRDGDLLYARSVSTGGDVLTDALAENFNVSKAKGESLKRELGDLRPRDRRSGLSQQAEKVSYALEGAAGRLFSTVQSTLQLAKAQMQLNQLNVAKVWLTGGSSAMKGLDEYLGASLGVPVQRFDPLRDAGVVVEGPAGSADMTVALGLAVMGVDGEAWSLEVIGAAERRKRDFARRHVFTAAAVALVAIYLGLAWHRYGARHEEATASHSAIRSENDKRQKRATRLESARAERAALAARVDVLEKRKAAGDGVLRALDLLVEHLPEDLWVSSLDLDYEEPTGRRGADRASKRPKIRVQGAGKSRGLRNVDDAYAEFIAAANALPAGDDARVAMLIEQQNPTRERFEFTLTLDYLEDPPPDPDEETAGEGGAPAGAASDRGGR